MKVNLAGTGFTPEMLVQMAERTRKEVESQPGRPRHDPVSEPTGRGQYTKNFFREQVATLAPMVESLTKRQMETGGAGDEGMAGLLRTFKEALERNQAALKNAPEAPGDSIWL